MAPGLAKLRSALDRRWAGEGLATLRSTTTPRGTGLQTCCRRPVPHSPVSGTPPTGSTASGRVDTEFHFPFANARMGQPSVKLILDKVRCSENAKVPGHRASTCRETASTQPLHAETRGPSRYQSPLNTQPSANKLPSTPCVPMTPEDTPKALEKVCPRQNGNAVSANCQPFGFLVTGQPYSFLVTEHPTVFWKLATLRLFWIVGIPSTLW